MSCRSFTGQANREALWSLLFLRPETFVVSGMYVRASVSTGIKSDRLFPGRVAAVRPQQ